MFFNFITPFLLLSFPSPHFLRSILSPSLSQIRSFNLFGTQKTIAYFGAALEIVTVQSHRVRHNCEFSHVPHAHTEHGIKNETKSNVIYTHTHVLYEARC